MASSPAMTVMIAAVRKAARALQRDFGEVGNLQVSQKGPGDYVTAADRRSDKILREELLKARPGYRLLSEESGASDGGDPDYRFIIDPIDGTTNFLHAVPQFAITVALERKAEIVAAVTYNPIADEMFHAEKGTGAFMNNRRMRVASRKEMHDALIAYEIPHRGGNALPRSRAELAVLQAETAGIRCFGSAALDLAYVAAGRVDAAVGRDLYAWDIAAGLLLVREAGGFASDCDSERNPMETGQVAAGNADLLPKVKAALREAAKI